ncbi:endonuclease/exonuclease/phosphatase family protein [uncultured Christiangramia sp.]|uniref:endonuclease/exonuclease/phosphatase family protein n=1 Tax=uncultured Christiangramia sp. TaxID=503836 RepID=UPI002613000E|nr:endonuclease/exonuclease/phosphatase family protein [uncultured Christiangramia sp.]
MEKNRTMIKIISFLIVLTSAFCSAQDISVMSYNIKYANENDGENSWSKRKDFITDQIQFYEPQILGLQEAVKIQIEHFLVEVDGYQSIGVAREDGREKGEFTAILYKTKDLEVEESSTFWLSETPEEVSTGWDAALPRICTYALLRNKDSGKKFWVFNTHFDHIGKNARTKSAELILKKIAELNTNQLPVFLMGDLNLEPHAEGVLNILKQLQDSRVIAQKTLGPEGTFNGFQFDKPVNRRIDYIFVNDQISVNKYAVLTDSNDLKYPSDHFPIYIEAEFEE